MKKVKLIIYGILAVAPLILSALYYARFSDTVAVQWGVGGIPSNYVSKNFAAWGIPAIMLGIVIFINLFMRFTPGKAGSVGIAGIDAMLKSILSWSVVILAIMVQGVIVLQSATQNALGLPVLIALLAVPVLIICGIYIIPFMLTSYRHKTV